MEFKHFENIKSQEKDEILKKIKDQILGLIKDKKTATIYFQKIEDIILSYDHPQEAAEILTECFERYVKYEFNEKNFSRFIRSIDPRIIFQNDASQSFYLWEDSEEGCPDNCTLKCDGTDYEKCRSQFIDEYNKNKILENKKTPRRMLDMRLYAMLQEDKTTDQDRIDKELALNTGPDPFKKLIYTPLGGQPGYKKKGGYK